MSATLVLVLGVGLGGTAPAQAEKDGLPRPDPPSREAVDAAKATAADKAAAVGRVKAALLLADQRLESAAVAAEHAAEAANGARWRLELASAALDRARADAAQARREVARQRDEIGALVAASYQQGSEVTALSAMMGADGPEGVLDQYAGFQGASTSLEADYQRFAAADALAEVFARKAAEAERRQREVATRAEQAQQRAAEAEAAAQQAAARIAEEKDRLVRELAEAQDISVRLARQRQAALEEIARQKAAERARREAEARARAQAEARAEARARAEAEAAERAQAAAAANAAAGNEQTDRPDQSSAPPASPTPPAPAPAPPAPPATPGGVDAALAFARAQVGEPYRWGASGPSAWDCSGLTMAAWAAGGVSLPHYSVAQYFAGTPITASELRPGDLVFWSSSSSPQGIHHVALYLGDGMIVHAPRTGRPVTVESMYYWIPPTHFVRL